jgi:hypothetical protein
MILLFGLVVTLTALIIESKDGLLLLFNSKKNPKTPNLPSDD